MADAIRSSRFAVLGHTGHLAARETPVPANQKVDAALALLSAKASKALQEANAAVRLCYRLFCFIAVGLLSAHPEARLRGLGVERGHSHLSRVRYAPTCTLLLLQSS